MTNKFLTVEFTVGQAPEAVYAAINNPRGWWSADITGDTSADVVFDITRADGKTQVRLTHVGLDPEIDYFDACTKGWEYYAGEQLPKLIAASPVTVSS